MVSKVKIIVTKQEMLDDDNVQLFKDMNNMMKRIENDESAAEPLKGKQVIVIFGTTGAGKSTMANALIKGHKNL